MLTRTSALASSLVLALLAAGCSAADSSDTSVADGRLADTGDLTVSLTILESNVIFASKALSFVVKGQEGLKLGCHDRFFSMYSSPTLYDHAWSPDDVSPFAEDAAGSDYHQYDVATCRDAATEVMAWFPAERAYSLSVTDQLLDPNSPYDPAHFPLFLRLTKLDANEASYFTCDGALDKTLVSETANSKRYDIQLQCHPRGEPSDVARGQLEYIAHPGAYAAINSYEPYPLPAVSSTQESFDRVRTALLAKVPAGSYTGAMSTLSKGCDLTIQQTPDGTLVVDHTIQSSKRKRHLELRPENLLGFVEGETYADPTHLRGAPQGTFAAAEFKDDKGNAFSVRFEANTSLDAKVVRVNGSTTYCRRLAAK